MEDQPISSTEAIELSVEEERPNHLQSRESQPQCCRTMDSPQSAPMFAGYYGVYQAPGPSPALDYTFPIVPLQHPSPYGGPGFVLMQSPIFPSDGRQYMPMVTSAPVQAIPVNETYRVGYHNVEPTTSLPSRESVRGSATRRPLHSSSHFEKPLATSTPRTSFSQGPNEQRRSAPTKRSNVPCRGTPVPSTFPPVSNLPFQHIPPSNVTYSVSPPVNQQTFTPAFPAGAASPSSSSRILSPSVPSRDMATYSSPVSPTEFVICSSSRRHPSSTQTHSLNNESGFDSVGSGLDESSRSPTNSLSSTGKTSDMQGRYYISGGQISFDPPLHLSYNEERYTGPPQSSQNVSTDNQTNLQKNSIQEWSDGRPQPLDGSDAADTTTTGQEWVEAKPVEDPRFYDASGPPPIPNEWIPPPDLSSTSKCHCPTPNANGYCRSTLDEPSYPSPDESNLQISSIQERSGGFSQTLDSSEMTKTEQIWVEAKPVKLDPGEEPSRPQQTVSAVVPPSSPDTSDVSARSSHAGVQTPGEWSVDGVSAAVQTPCGWEGGPTATPPAFPLTYCAGSCPKNRDTSRRKRRRKRVYCDYCKAEMKDKVQKEDIVDEPDSKINVIESFGADSTDSTSHEQTLVPPSQEPEENENNEEPQDNENNEEHQDNENNEEPEQETPEV